MDLHLLAAFNILFCNCSLILTLLFQYVTQCSLVTPLDMLNILVSNALILAYCT